jgi:hypothetical protein
MPTLSIRDHPSLRALVFTLRPQLSRPRRNDAGARPLARSHDDLPLGSGLCSGVREKNSSSLETDERLLRRRPLLRIDDSISGRRRVAPQQRTSISVRGGSPSIDLIVITAELTGSPTLCGSLVTMMQPADLRNCDDLALRCRFDPSWKMISLTASSSRPDELFGTDR